MLMKPRRMRRVGNVSTHGGDTKTLYITLVGKFEGSRRLEGLGVGGRIILKLIWKKQGGKFWT